jgi:DNA-binding PadR family transcriptional regulator
MVRYAILGLLRTGVARHGYALLKEYRWLSGCQLSVGNIYRELQRLLSDGLIEPTPNPPGADARRTPYRITREGVVAFDAWLTNPRTGNVGDYHDEMSLRACLVVQMAGSPVGEVLDRWKEELTIRRSALSRERPGTARPTSIGSGEQFDSLTLLAGRRLKHLAVDVEFVEDLRAAYGAWSNGSSPRGRTVHGRRVAGRG